MRTLGIVLTTCFCIGSLYSTYDMGSGGPASTWSFLHNVTFDAQVKEDMSEHIVIAFDLHEVVFKLSYKKLLKAVYGFFKKNPLYNIALLNPRAVYRVYKVMSHTSRTAENIYDTLTRLYYPGLRESKSEFLAVCNAYELDQEMEKLIKALKSKGYRITVCSNIGRQAFNDFCKEYADLFQQCELIVTACPQREYQRKPSIGFFENFKQECLNNFDNDNLCYYFIDDKKRMLMRQSSVE